MSFEKFSEAGKKIFYDHYFDADDIVSYRYDVGAKATRGAILEKMTIHKGTILEIGTGISSLLLDLQQEPFDCFGIDISEPTITKIKHWFDTVKASAQFFTANAEALPFGDSFFDSIVSSHTFEHIKDDARAFSECTRVLKPGGELILFVPGRIDGTATIQEWESLGHYRSYNRARMEALAKSSKGTMELESIEYVHKVHNLVWNRLKNVFRWVNYPFKKWVMRDGKSYEHRFVYQKIALPVLMKTLSFFDSFTKNKQKNFLGAEFNVLVRFRKI